MMIPDNAPDADTLQRYQMMGKLLEKAKALGAPMVVRMKDGDSHVYRHTFDDSQEDLMVSIPFTEDMIDMFCQINPPPES